MNRIRGRLRPLGNACPDASIGHAWEHDDLATSSGAAIDELMFNEGIARVLVRAGTAAGDTVTAQTTPARTFPRLRVLATTTDSIGPDSLTQLSAVKDTLRGDVVISGTIPQGDSATLTVAFRDPSEAYLAALEERIPRNPVRPEAAELANLHAVGRLIVGCAILRAESRGLHFNVSHPATDPALRRDTIIIPAQPEEIPT